METAFIGILGAILGFAASYILEARKRRWTREEQWREWQRDELEKLSKKYREIQELGREIFFAAADTAKREFGTSEKWEDVTTKSMPGIITALMSLESDPPPLPDRKLEDLNDQIMGDIVKITLEEGQEDKPKNAEEYVNVISNLLELIRKAQVRVNELKEKTYK